MGTRRPFFIVPSKRYIYVPPKGFREKKDSGTEKKSSPFVSMWFCWGGDQDATDKLVQWGSSQKFESVDIARSKSALRDLRRGGKK
jgi:hypothetical protein